MTRMTERGTCPACGRLVPLRKNGTVRKHKVRRGPCPGAGEVAS